MIPMCVCVTADALGVLSHGPPCHRNQIEIPRSADQEFRGIGESLHTRCYVALLHIIPALFYPILTKRN